jgi:hypothetical protein
VLLSLGLFFLGRGTGIKKMDKDAVEADNNFTPGALLTYLAAMVLLVFASSYEPLREHFIKKYDNKDYVWVSGTKQFVDKDGKTYFYTLDSTIKKKNDILKQHEVQEELIEPQEQEGE